MPPTKFMIKQAQKYARKKGIKPSDLLDLMEFESGFDPGAVSSAGARGLTQFMPTTAPSYNVQFGTSKKAQKTQIRGAAKFLKKSGYEAGNEAAIRGALADYFGAASPYADELLSQETYAKYDKKMVSVPGASKKKTPKPTKKGATTKTVQTQAAVDNSAARAQIALAFIQDEDKTLSDYVSIAEGLASLKDQPAQYEKVKEAAKKKKESVSIEAPKGKATSVGSKAPKNIVAIGKLAQRMGLSVGENPHFGGVDPVHTSGSYHYSGRAIDVSGDAAKMAAFANKIKKKYGKHLAELFWNGQNAANIDNGQEVEKGYVSGHTDHVHVAV